MEEENHKCQFPDGITIKPDGIHELDPCIYKDIACYKNVTVIISQCVKCGNISVSWKPQPNTVIVSEEEEESEE